MCNYKNLSIHQRINFKSWRLSEGPKLFKADITEFWDSDAMHDARLFGEYPLTESIKRNHVAIMRRKYPDA